MCQADAKHGCAVLGGSLAQEHWDGPTTYAALRPTDIAQPLASPRSPAPSAARSAVSSPAASAAGAATAPSSGQRFTFERPSSGGSGGSGRKSGIARSTGTAGSSGGGCRNDSDDGAMVASLEHAGACLGSCLSSKNGTSQFQLQHSLPVRLPVRNATRLVLAVDVTVELKGPETAETAETAVAAAAEAARNNGTRALAQALAMVRASLRGSIVFASTAAALGVVSGPSAGGGAGASCVARAGTAATEAGVAEESAPEMLLPQGPASKQQQQHKDTEKDTRAVRGGAGVVFRGRIPLVLPGPPAPSPSLALSPSPFHSGRVWCTAAFDSGPEAFFPPAMVVGASPGAPPPSSQSQPLQWALFRITPSTIIEVGAPPSVPLQFSSSSSPRTPSSPSPPSPPSRPTTAPGSGGNSSDTWEGAWTGVGGLAKQVPTISTTAV